MNGHSSFLLFIVASIFLHDATSGVHAWSTNFSTESFSFNTPTDTCDDCIQRARDYYSRTVSDPEHFCVENHLCVKNPDAGSPPEIPQVEASLLPNTVQAHEPSSLPSDGPSLFPSAEPSLRRNSLPSGEPSLFASTVPSLSPSSLPSDRQSNNESIDDQTDMPNSIPSISPTVLPTTNTSTLTLFDSLEATPTKPPESLPLPMDAVNLDPTMTNNDLWRTAISSLFLKNLTSAMNLEVAEVFSITALDFLRDYSRSLSLSEEIDFILVEVVGQGPELGDSTKFEAHIDGMHIFFETVVYVKVDEQIDVPRLIETIFKTNKNDFFSRLAESNEFFIPLDPESRSNQIPSMRDFMSSWVISSLAVVGSSVFLAAILLARRIQRTRPRRYHQESSKQDTCPLYTLEQTCSSEESNETNKTGDDKAINPRDKNAVDILMNLEGDSLAGLKLLLSEDNDSLEISPRDTGSNQKQKFEASTLNVETEINSTEEIKRVLKPGHDARMRKRKLEQDFKKRRSEEGTSLGAILMATSSLNSDDDVGEQKSNLEVPTGQFESISNRAVQKTSIMDQISSIFRNANKKQPTRRLEPVRKIEEDDSDCSCLSTPAYSPSNRLNSFGEVVGSDRADEDRYLSISADILPDFNKAYGN